MVWIVAVTKPQQESWAAENVKRQGHEYYLPRFQENYVRKQRVLTRVKPLFPRYLFVEIDQHWLWLVSTFGMAGVVLKGETPAIMPDSEIAKMKKRQGKDGLIKLPPKPKPAGFRRGQKLKVTNHGLLTGFDAICQYDDDSERVKVLLQFLGASRSVYLPRNSLIAA